MLLAGCGSDGRSGGETKTFDVSGTMTLTTSSGVVGGEGVCLGSGGYDDLREGAPVVVYDASGKKVAIGELGPGVPDSEYPTVSCHFDFSVADVPTGDTVYSVEVASRGEVSFKPADAKSLELSIGN